MLVELDDQSEEALRRVRMQQRLEGDPALQGLAKRIFVEDPAAWIDDWAWSYEPRQLDMPSQPFRLSPRQREMVDWLVDVVERKEEGLLEKSRDVGASWIISLFALNRFLFVPGFKTTLGAATAHNVDQIGDPDSLFEKVRIALDMLPRWQHPAGFKPSEHDNHMRLINPENGNTIVGEVGKNLGRGGRSTLIVIDEAAFVDQARSVARAVSANADAKLWVSTANGMANQFYLKRESARARDPSLVFRFHWRDDPRRDQEWAARRRAEMEPEDWASEYEIDYGASVERQLVKAEWVAACRELAMSRRAEARGLTRSGLDVGAGKAESVLATMSGPLLNDVRAWKDPDAVDTASLALEHAASLGSTVVRYDATGVGFAQGAIMARMAGPRRVAINLGDPVPPEFSIREGDRTVRASERFANLKAWGWWQVRERAKASWELVEGVAEHSLDDCLLLGVADPMLEAQLCQPTWSKTLRGKRQVDKAPDGARSPDRADALVLALLDVGAKGGGSVRYALG